jgi:hypothetical protein
MSSVRPRIGAGRRRRRAMRPKDPEWPTLARSAWGIMATRTRCRGAVRRRAHDRSTRRRAALFGQRASTIDRAFGFPSRVGTFPPLRSVGCPWHGCCCGRRTVARQNSDSDRSRYWVSGFPTLVREWDRDRNGTLTPDVVTAGSARMIWWRCDKGEDHRWRAKPNNRTSGGTGCPFCANRRPSVTNSLQTCCGAIAAEWHPTRNGRATPRDVTIASTRVCWWRCSVNPAHEWRAGVRDRVRLQATCPYCAHRRVADESSLAYAFPAVASEWHPTRNGALSPRDVLPGSRRPVWWQCARDPSHCWRAAVGNRTLRASACPYCAGRRGTPRP